MKRIGVVTWYGGSNYGTSLQAYALCWVLSRLGVVPFLLKKHMTWRNLLGRWRRKLLQSKKAYALNGYGSKKKKKIEKFRKRNFNQFHQCYGKIGSFLFRKQILSLNGVISGSDQLWNPYHTEPFLLLEGMNVKKYSYASSIGVMEIPDDKKFVYRHALSTFDSISVREQSAVKPLEEISGKRVEKVLDPTFLIERKYWDDFATQSSLKDVTLRPYILCYFVGDDTGYWDKVAQVRERTGIDRVIVLPMHPNQFKKDMEIMEDAGLEDFVCLIAHAAIVCTDSFHATAISINLRKNFVTLLRFSDEEKKSQNSRLGDMLASYALLDRLWTGEHVVDVSRNIDYAMVDKKLSEERARSMGYLKRIVESC